MKLPRGPAAALALGLASCTGVQDPSLSEAWAADLIARRQVLFMTFTRNGSGISGTGSLTDLAASVGEPLTLTGIRYGDTLEITYRRPVADAFRFAGWYTPQGTLQGILDGAEFDREAVLFRDR